MRHVGVSVFNLLKLQVICIINSVVLSMLLVTYTVVCRQVLQQHVPFYKG